MPIEKNQSTIITIDGKQYRYFGGANYLGLAHRPELLQTATSAFRSYGFSSGASRLTSGENDLITKLEQNLAEFARAPAALALPTGYMANLAVIDAIDDLVDVWVIQEQSHGSRFRSAVNQSRSRVLVVDWSKEDRSIRQRFDLPWGCKLGILVEVIDPLLGKLFDMRSLLRSSIESDFIVLDEAHSFGVIGDNGIGALEHFGLQGRERLIRTGTCSNALGTSGGYVLASDQIITQIMQRSDCYKMSSTISPVVCGATLEALRLMQEDFDGTIGKLRANVARMNQGLNKVGLNNYESNVVPIFCLRNSPAVSKLREALPECGIYAPSVTSYFESISEIGLRWTVQAGHGDEDLDLLMHIVAKHVTVQSKQSG